LCINLGRNAEENHGILKGAMVDQWAVTLHEVELYVVKWYCDRLMYIFIKKLILKEFRYVLCYVYWLKHLCCWNLENLGRNIEDFEKLGFEDSIIFG
jgi:hypothetical protein